MNYNELLAQIERLPTNFTEWAVFSLAILIAISLFYCVLMTFTRLMDSGLRSRKLQGWFLGVSCVGKMILATALFEWSVSGLWNGGFIIYGTAFWFFGRTGMDLIDIYMKRRFPFSIGRRRLTKCE